jgi:hypothetical protein
MQRITLSDINAVIARINRETNSPADPYVRNADGKLVAQPGCYHLSRAYGGYSLHRMVNESGGCSDVFYCGHVPARELFNRMHAFLAGINQARAA